MKQAFQSLCKPLKEIANLNGVKGLLMWDSEVMMAAGSQVARSEQQVSLGGLIHSLKTDKKIGEMLEKAEQELQANPEEFNQWEKSVVRDTRIAYDRDVKVPLEIAQEHSRLSSLGPALWVKAREENDADSFTDFLQQWVDLQKERTSAIDNSRDSYNVLLNEYERGYDSQQIQSFFSNIKEKLVPLLQHIKKVQQNKPGEQPCRAKLEEITFPIDAQRELSKQIAKELGFDMNCGRIDSSAHPFTSMIDTTDVRITTRYKESSFIESITGTIHETGHAIYEQNRPQGTGVPISGALSMGVHESQSLLYERMVGLSSEFWDHYWDRLIVPTFPELRGRMDSKEFYRAVNMVRPGLIRVEADECTYPLHIILRTEIEKGLLEGAIKAKDVPDLWNSKMKEYLDVDVPTHQQGFLQDIHWSMGYFGYFPTYLLGAVFAAQIFEATNGNITSLREQIGTGEFLPLKDWLAENIHSKELLYDSTDDLIKAATGKPVDVSVYTSYLEQKYAKLYPAV